MRKVFGLVSLLCIPFAAISAESSPDIADHYDLVVYGATASGVATAVSGAREGLNVALIEPRKNVGGMVSGGLSNTDHGNKKCIGGFAIEFYKRLGKYYDEPITWRPEPHVAENTFKQMLEEAGVPVYFNQRLLEHDGITTDGVRIVSIKTENGDVFKGEVFADCTYEGDLMAKSGVTYTFGREGHDVYGEDLAGVRAETKSHQFTADVKARNDDGKLLPLVQEGPMGEPGQGDKKIQAYNFRLCMTQNKDNMVPFPKPPNYDPDRYDLLARLLGELVAKNDAPPKAKYLMILSRIKGDKTDTNNRGAISTDHIGGNWGYPDGTYAEREKIWNDHYEYVAGFFYFLANDPRVPLGLHKEMQTWGLAADEFTENGNWPHQLYVREGRRMIGEYVMTQSDIQTDYLKDDVIGMGSYRSDSHNVQRFENANGFAENEGDMQVHVTPYHIPYRMITPKRDEIENLLVPVCFSASHVAYSTIRMEPQYMIIGQAAGVAASMAAQADTAVQDVDSAALTSRLSELDAVLELDDYVTTGPQN